MSAERPETPPNQPPEPPPAGLCERCQNARVVRSARSAFVRCGLSDEDPGFARYPNLPVLACLGFVPRPPAAPPRSCR